MWKKVLVLRFSSSRSRNDGDLEFIGNVLCWPSAANTGELDYECVISGLVENIALNMKSASIRSDPG